MAYVKQNFVKGQILTAEHMNHIEDGIVAAADAQSLGGVAAGSYALKTDVAPDSTMLGGKAPEYYIQPRNLLDNSDFRNPVNQRGETTYTGSLYTIDRWRTWSSSSTVTITSDGIKGDGTDASVLYQNIEDNKIPWDKAYTMAVGYSDGSVLCASGVFTSEQGVGIWSSEAQAYLANTDSKTTRLIRLWHATKTIVWAALYEGVYDASTLPPYVPKGYAAELAECMRYFQTIPYYFAQNSVNANSDYPSYFPIQFFPMRIAPTVTLNESWNSNMTSKTTTRVTTRSLSIGFVLDSTSNGYLQWNGSIILSADL